MFDHVSDVAVNTLSVQGSNQAKSALRIIESADVLITAARLLTPAAVFLQVEGPASQGIILDGGDLSKAAKPLSLASAAPEKSVHVRL
jgi:hypothetical protein